MLVFGHAGITFGAAALLAGAAKSRHYSRIWKIPWITSLSSYVDIRILFIGSLLPDIIDKPVGQYFFRETFSCGRIFSHTLLFLVILTVAGLFLYRSRRKVWLLTLAFGTFVHLVLDSMWTIPQTLFWPFLGFTFGRADLTDWVANILHALISNPEFYVPELVGVVILLWFGLSLAVRKKVGVFIKYGKNL